jgi:hypothetical protein
MRSATLIAFAVLGSTSILHAQITVQQPVVRNTGVATTVSVPDRGSTFLGGISSAESSRSSYGPLRTGTSRGYGLSGTSISAHVYIIDLQAMDEAILNSVPDSPPPGPLMLRPRPMDGGRDPAPRLEALPAEKAANFERLARQAESAGKAGVAKLHWQMAARYGSTLAKDKLNPPTVDAARATAGR